ncbi:MAG: YbhB/YbcL family Raf kinase inhibitor-like protein [Phycisphaerales bacterium]|nr:YbhB/YbcL family Raf kinase inhibitor-like protein [Phycisphaerales bacterium]
MSERPHKSVRSSRFSERVTKLFAAAGAMSAAYGVAADYRPSGETAAAPSTASSDASTDAAEVAGQGDIPMTIKVESPAFVNNAKIPTKFTGDGEDVSPGLTWSNLPAGARELALICDDPDAPTSEPWVHWVIYRIAADAKGLPENVAKTASPAEPKGALQGKNSWSKIGYGGPAPPKGHGVHHYHFKLYALDAPLNVSSGLTKKDMLAAMKGHILAQGELVGTYQR